MDKLIVYGQTLIEDGWPVGNLVKFSAMERRLLVEQRELQTRISKIRKLQDNAESLLRTPGIVPKTVEDWVTCVLLAIQRGSIPDCAYPQPEKLIPTVVVDETAPFAASSAQQPNILPSPKQSDQSILDGVSMYVTAGQLSRRTCPSTSCGIVGYLLENEKVTVHERKNGWVRIREVVAEIRTGC